MFGSMLPRNYKENKIVFDIKQNVLGITARN
jgi:hypothetical protein